MGGARVQRAGLARGTRYGFAGPGAPRHRRTESTYSSGLMGVELPHPGVVNLRGAQLQKPRVGAPGPLVPVHLEQLLMDARVHAGGDWGLDLQGLACQGVLVVSITIVQSDAAGVPQRGGGLVACGVLGAHVPGSGWHLAGEWRQGVWELRQCACRSRP